MTGRPWLVVIALSACAGERATTPPVAPPPPPAASAPAPIAPAPSPAEPAGVSPTPPLGEPTAAADAAAPAPAVDRSHCPKTTALAIGADWRPVTSMNGLSEAELRVCFGEPRRATADRLLFGLPRGCSDRRIELEVTLQNGRATRARSRQIQTNEHCAE